MMKRILLVSVLLLAACSAQKVLTDRQYFDSGTAAMEKEAFDLAIDQYQKLMEEYPFSEYTEEAQLKIAYAQYRSKRYAEAIASFQDFERMHPTNANLPFAEFHLAMSYMDQMGKNDRDQSASEQAHVHFQALIDRYPESPFAEQAKQKLRECREALAKHELTIARFYLHWGNPLGAESRLRYMLERYPDTDTGAEALITFGDHFRGQGDLVRAALAYAALTEAFPQSRRVADAKLALERLAVKNVQPSDRPLAELQETLGRPSPTAQPAAVEDRPSAAALPSEPSEPG